MSLANIFYLDPVNAILIAFIGIVQIPMDRHYNTKPAEKVAVDFPDWKGSIRTETMYNKSTILNAAAEFLAKKSSTDLDLAEVAEIAGVNRASIYNYFGSRHTRSQILSEIVGQFLESAEGKISAVSYAGHVGSPIAQLIAILRVTFLSFREHPVFGQVVLRHLNLNDDCFGRVRIIFGIVDEILKRAISEGEISSDVEVWKIRHALFFSAFGFLRSIHLKEKLQMTDPNITEISETEAEKAVLQVLQKFCLTEAQGRVQEHISALVPQPS